MKHLLKIVIVLFTLNCAAASAESPDTYDIYGKPFYKSAYKGKAVVINYWSETCGPCAEEIPELNRLYSISQSRNFAFFAVNINGLSTSSQQLYAAMHHVKFPMMEANPYTNIDFDSYVQVLPTTFIISSTGRVVVLQGTQSAGEILSAVG